MKNELDALVNQLVGRGILMNEALQELEKRFIRRVLENHNGNQCRAAKVLGIHRNTLGRKIDLYKLSTNHRRR